MMSSSKKDSANNNNVNKGQTNHNREIRQDSKSVPQNIPLPINNKPKPPSETTSTESRRK